MRYVYQSRELDTYLFKCADIIRNTVDIGQPVEVVDDLVYLVVSALNILVEFLGSLDSLTVPFEAVSHVANAGECYRLQSIYRRVRLYEDASVAFTSSSMVSSSASR